MSDDNLKTKYAVGAAVGVAVVAAGAYYLLSRRDGSEAGEADKAPAPAAPSNTTGATTSEPAAASTGDSGAPAADDEGLTPEEAANKYKSLGNKFYKGGNYKKAIEFYTKALDISPPGNDKNKAIYAANRAASYIPLGMHDEAIADCNLAIQLEPTYVKALNRRGTIFALNKNMLREGLKDLTAACLLDGFQNQNFARICEEVLTKLSTQKAKELMKTKSFPIPSPHTFRQYFSTYYSEDEDIGSLTPPGDDAGGDAWYLHAKALCAAEKFEDAFEAIKKSVAGAAGEHVAAAHRLHGAFLHLQGGHDEEALAAFQKSLDADPKSIETLLMRADVYAQQQDTLALCEEAFKQAFEINPEDPNVFHHRAQLRFLSGKYNDALVDYQKASELQPKFEQARIQVAICQYHLQQHETAISTLKATIETFPNSSTARNYLGELLLAQQKFERANSEFTEAMRINPSCPLAFVNQGTLLFQWKQDHAEALKLLQKAVEMDPKSAIAHNYLGTVYLQLRDPRCIAEFEKSIEFARTPSELENAVATLEAAHSQLSFFENYPEKAKA